MDASVAQSSVSHVNEEGIWYPAVIPMLAYEHAGRAAEWLCRVFGFRERTSQRYEENGVVSHAELEAGNGLIMIATPTPAYQSPAHHRQECEATDAWLTAPWVIDGVHVYVPDIDAHYEHARASGARLLSGIVDEPYGRLYRVEDIEGHRWMFMEGQGS